MELLYQWFVAILTYTLLLGKPLLINQHFYIKVFVYKIHYV